MRMKYLFSLVLGAAVAALSLHGYGSAVAQESRQLLLVEAGFVLKFPSFVTWPPGNTIEQRGFQLCVLGETDIERSLREVARHTVLFGSEPAVRRIYSLTGVVDCHLLFISSSEAARIGDIVSYVQHKPILTVSGTHGYVDKGVMINLFLDEAKVRFEINRAAVENSALTMSFRLLEAASKIR